MDSNKKLIEELLPIQELGIESRRERGASSALPPLYFLHVWWARRPLTVSRTAVLANLLPSDTDEGWFKSVLGIKGDPVKAQKKIQEAKKTGLRLKSNPYGYKRAFTYTPVLRELEEIKEKAGVNSLEDFTVLDPMAGGGSIPFEAMRYGLNTFANEYNPVAFVILKATMEYPAKYGQELGKDIKRWAEIVGKNAREELEKYFPKQKGEEILGYLWARTVTCPECDLTVPLSPNWWVQRNGSQGVAAKVVPPREGSTCSFRLIEVRDTKDYNPQNGTVSRGVGKCPRCSSSIEGRYIKREAREGRMRQQLYAVVKRKRGGKGRQFRLPSAEDIKATTKAEQCLKKKMPEWSRKRLVPEEGIPDGLKTNEPQLYGIFKWKDMFASRQLLTHLTYLEKLNEVKKKLFEEEPEEKARAIATYLAIIFDKCIDYNSLLSSWHAPRTLVRNTFDSHDFRFKWSFAEFDNSEMLWPWATSQVLDAYRELARLAGNNANGVHVSLASAAALDMEDDSIDLIVVDPPYYNNVMYGELSDYFYVWMKRSLGDVFPEAFAEELTNKDDEAVANPARFRRIEGSAGTHADRDYERKMAACFREMKRILKPGGNLTIMFTHKRVDAWDSLSYALLEAGFEIVSSWPIHTESIHSLHQAKKNAAASTILLTCEKKEDGESKEEGWWEELRPTIYRVARDKAEEYGKHGIKGVDLGLSIFGPVLNVLSRYWPVMDRSGEPIRPDLALNTAREAVNSYELEGYGNFDKTTKWYVLAWKLFKAVEFNFDEGRKLAITVGVNLEKLKAKKLWKKKSGSMRLLSPEERFKAGKIDPEDESFDTAIDAVHTAMYIHKEDGPRAVRQFYVRTGLLRDRSFLSAYDALLDVIPGIRDEHKVLEDIALVNMKDKVKLKKSALDTGRQRGIDEEWQP